MGADVTPVQYTQDGFRNDVGRKPGPKSKPIATLELLERFGHEVVYPRDQTCCGQPMGNSGFNSESAATEGLFVRNFSGFDYIVAPSGSCVDHVRTKFDAIEQAPEVREVRARTFELVEFLHDIEKVDAFPWARFPHRVSWHSSCQTRGEPQELADVDFAVVRAAFAVAETGSVLLHERELRVNAVAYLAQHLIALLDPAELVMNLHHAYCRPEFRAGHYACFHTGPSATADIEGVLIHGAQGVRSLSVVPLAWATVSHS
jgi:hypothetical protein